MDTAIFSTSYLAPILYYSELVKFETITIELYDSYCKQTYRNRCTILGANGTLDLIIPIQKQKGEKTVVRDVRISYDTLWQKMHWRSIVSAYNNSPYFEYLRHDFEPIYKKKFEFLIDLNLKLLETTLTLMELEKGILLSSEYLKEKSYSYDYRDSFSPKNAKINDLENFNLSKYTQTFSEKFEFVPNLSILDLLFNVGPDCISLLEAKQ